jgi:hypothetical protein
MDTDSKPKRSAIYLKAEAMLPPELRPIFEQLLAEYQFASVKHHGRAFSSPRVIAELVLMGWRSPPLPTTSSRTIR